MSRLGDANGRGISRIAHWLRVLTVLVLASVATEAVLYGIGWATGISDDVFFPPRIVVWFAVLTFCYAFRPHGRLFSTSVESGGKLLSHGLAGVVAVALVVVVVISMAHPYYLGILSMDGSDNPPRPIWYNEGAQDEYDLLAQALLEGRVSLDVQPPDYLASMDNPYDPAARDQLVDQTGQDYRWDTAYFEGSYYVYFGVVPCLVFFVPYRILTGGACLPTGTVVDILSIAYIAGAAMFVSYLTKKRFNHARVGSVLLGYMGMLLCSGMLEALFYPSLYLIPMAASLALSIWGFYFWLRAWESGGIRPIAAGSSCLALVLGCRPTLAITACFAMLFLAAFIRCARGRTARDSTLDGVVENPLAYETRARICDATGARCGAFDSALSVHAIAALLVPFAVVIAGLFWYNAVRFGSPFDFGSSYNLTVTDLTSRTFEIARIPNGIYNYLLQPPVLSSDFPYLQPAGLDTAYGDDYVEPMVGGVLLCYPFLWACLAVYRLRSHRTTTVAVIVLCCCATVLAVLDIEVGGLLARYQMDFTFMFAIAATIAVICRSHDRSPVQMTMTAEDGTSYTVWRVVLVMLILATAVFCVLYSLFLLSSVSGATGTDFFGSFPDAQRFAENFFRF